MMGLEGTIPPNVAGYRQVDLVWTLADSRRARREGWDVFREPDGRLIIDVWKPACVFVTDLQAIEHCMVMADISTLHARALAIHFYSLATRER